MRYFLPVILVLLLAGWAQCATYYLDPDGSDIAAGTSAETAWKTPARAILNVGAGDVLTVLGTASNPVRDQLTPAAAATITAPETGYLTASRDLSEGGVYRIDYFYNGRGFEGFETWDSAVDVEYFAESGTVEQEAVEIANGTYSAKVTSSGTASYLRISPTNVPLVPVRFGIIYKAAEGSSVKLLRKANNLYLTSEGTWVEEASYFGEYSSTLWTIQYSPWGKATGGNTSRIDIVVPPTDKTVYVDGYFMEAKNEWDSVSGDIYSLNYVSSGDDGGINVLFSCSDAEWTTSGVEALLQLTEATITTGLSDISAGEWYYDRDGTYGDANLLYYRLSSNESDIADIHFEATDNIHYAMSISTDTTISNIHAWGGRYGMFFDDSTSTVSNSKASKNGTFGIYVTGASAVTMTDVEQYGSTGFNKFHGSGISVGDTSTLTCNRCYTHGNTDDGFGAGGGSTMNLYWSLSRDNDGCAIEMQQESGTSNIYNCTFITSSGASTYMDTSDSLTTNTFMNNIFIKIDPISTGLVPIMSVSVADEPNVVSENNLSYLDGPGTQLFYEPFSSDLTHINADPEINTDTGSASNSSPYIGSGIKITGFHDLTSQDYDGTQVVPWRIPIGAQGFAPTSNLRWGKIYGRH